MSEDFIFIPMPFAEYLEQHRPKHYHRDGKPIVDSPEGVPAWEQWALMFEDTKGRTVGNSRTLYGERLSTVWLGLDHNFGNGRPLIFETMLFAPDDNELRREYLKSFVGKGPSPEKQAAYKRQQAYIAKHYPHDQLQLRYATEREAYDRHEKLKLQCLVPPRWRRFILGVIGGDSTWLRWDDKDEDVWK
jgi:hypothetical protein